MKSTIHQPDPTTEILTQEGCWILESWNSPGDAAVSIARARVTPGTTTQLHRLLGVEERYLIIAGSGLVKIGSLAPAKVGPGDIVVIPAGEPQQVTNNGKTDLIFYCVCTPRFTPACYQPCAV